jgi:hypothetical protein
MSGEIKEVGSAMHLKLVDEQSGSEQLEEERFLDTIESFCKLRGTKHAKDMSYLSNYTLNNAGKQFIDLVLGSGIEKAFILTDRSI